MALVSGNTQRPTSQVLLGGQDAASPEKPIGVLVHHEHGGFVSSRPDGRHHLRVRHSHHRLAVHLGGGQGTGSQVVPNWRRSPATASNVTLESTFVSAAPRSVPLVHSLFSLTPCKPHAKFSSGKGQKHQSEHELPNNTQTMTSFLNNSLQAELRMGVGSC